MKDKFLDKKIKIFVDKKEIGQCSSIELPIKHVVSDIDLIIFSKNRAYQLDGLLSSIRKNCNIFNRIIVLKYASQAFYDIAYKEIKGNFVLFHQDRRKEDFRSILIAIFSACGISALYVNKYTCFMCDDDIMYRRFEGKIDLKKNEVYSLRLGENVKPKVHFDYPLSVDGHIYRTKDILPLIESIEFDNPNELESRLQKYKDRFTLKYDKQVLVGITDNKVSDTSGCSDMGGSPKELNDRFLRGERMDWKSIDFSRANNVHLNIKL